MKLQPDGSLYCDDCNAAFWSDMSLLVNATGWRMKREREGGGERVRACLLSFRLFSKDRSHAVKAFDFGGTPEAKNVSMSVCSNNPVSLCEHVRTQTFSNLWTNTLPFSHKSFDAFKCMCLYKIPSWQLIKDWISYLILWNWTLKKKKKTWPLVWNKNGSCERWKDIQLCQNPSQMQNLLSRFWQTCCCLQHNRSEPMNSTWISKEDQN